MSVLVDVLVMAELTLAMVVLIGLVIIMILEYRD